jgi:hypothetical protein
MNIFEEAADNIGHKHRSANACAMNEETSGNIGHKHRAANACAMNDVLI